MPNKKKRTKGRTIPIADFFGIHHEPATETGYSSGDEQETFLTSQQQRDQQERDRQKSASALASKRIEATKQQLAVLLGEERDHRTNLTEQEARTKTYLEQNINENLIEQEWIEFQVARREAEKHQEATKKAAMTQFGTQEMLNRANIADKETEQRFSLFNSFMRATVTAKESETKRLAKDKLEADRKKAADRAKAYEERSRKSQALPTQKPGLFRPEPTPLGATTPAVNTTSAKEPEKKAGWWPW